MTCLITSRRISADTSPATASTQVALLDVVAQDDERVPLGCSRETICRTGKASARPDR